MAMSPAVLAVSHQAGNAVLVEREDATLLTNVAGWVRTENMAVVLPVKPATALEVS